MKPVKIIRIILSFLLCTTSLLFYIRSGFSQAIDPALVDFVRQTITNSVAGTIAFTSTDAISTGSFIFHENDERGDTKFNISRIPVRHFFSRWKDSEYAPFITGSLGYFEDSEKVLIGEPPDESHFKALSLSLGGGVKLELIKKYLWLIPELDLIYGRTWNEHDYNSDLSRNVIKPVLDGILFNWQVDTLTYAPALQLVLEYPVRAVKLGFDTKLTYLDIRTIKTDSPEQEVRSDSTLWKNRFRFEFPLGVSAYNMPLSLRWDFSRVDLGGVVARPLKESFFYEMGTELAFDSSRNVNWLKSFSIGAGYTFSQRITGWSFRLGYKF